MPEVGSSLGETLSGSATHLATSEGTALVLVQFQQGILYPGLSGRDTVAVYPVAPATLP